MTIRTGLSFVGVALLGSMLGGCALTGLGGGDPARMFVLSAAEGTADALPKVNAALTVKEPYTSAEFNTPKIVYQPSAHEVLYIAGVRWADTAPLMVQSRLLADFEDAGVFTAVARTGSGLRARYDIQTELRQFGLKGPGGDMVAHVALRVNIVDMREGQLVAQSQFAAAQATAGPGQAELVEAIDAAADRVVAETVSWTAQTLSALQPSS